MQRTWLDSLNARVLNSSFHRNSISQSFTNLFIFIRCQTPAYESGYFIALELHGTTTDGSFRQPKWLAGTLGTVPSCQNPTTPKPIVASVTFAAKAIMAWYH
jgi:hypothetical protein